VQLVGDDLFVTNTEILARGIAEQVANAILIKPNQIGTLTETLAAIEMATQAGYAAVVSHRSARPRTRRSPTSRSAPRRRRSRPDRSSRSDRVAKYNQLLRIESSSGRAPVTPVARLSRCAGVEPGSKHARRTCYAARPMKLVIAALLAAFVLLQYRLWVSNEGMREVWHLQQAVPASSPRTRCLPSATPRSRPKSPTSSTG
jgi:hypothetical protein